MRIDILMTPSTHRKARILLKGIYEGALRHGHDARIFVAGSVREGAMLVLYGMGGPDRAGYRDHRPLIAFDAGYWQRKLEPHKRKFRVSFNGDHCPDYIFKGACPSRQRLDSARLAFGEVARLQGPILLVGNGPKTLVSGALGWTAKRSRDVKMAFPERRVIYRPKPRRPKEGGVMYSSLSSPNDIDDVLNGISLVVCRHSNVAIDACRLGVPVVCDAGAAACIYPSKLADFRLQPSMEKRLEFLTRLAWFQWSPEECLGDVFWPWALKMLC